jgi:hypothetical protein
MLSYQSVPLMDPSTMKSFIDRNPKEKAVEEAFAVLARNGYESERPDPADNVFVVAEQLKRQLDQVKASPSAPESP